MVILVGSQFPTTGQVYLIRQINEVKVAMATGATVMLVEHDNIYESLYDVLNQLRAAGERAHGRDVQAAAPRRPGGHLHPP